MYKCYNMTASTARVIPFLQMRIVVRGYVENVNKEGSILGDTLETALEYGEKFDELVAKYKTVSHALNSLASTYTYSIVGNFGEVFNLAINFGEFGIDRQIKNSPI